MNDLPLLDSSFMRKGFWDRQGANMASCSKEMYGQKLFWRPKSRFFEDLDAFSPLFLSETDLDHVDTWGV